MVVEERKKSRIERGDSAIIESLVGLRIVDCEIKNISAIGARVAVPNAEVLPDYFKLSIAGKCGQLSPKCRVRWRAGNEVGVAFFG